VILNPETKNVMGGNLQSKIESGVLGCVTHYSQRGKEIIKKVFSG
jgi:hypothetical protein